MGLGGISYLVNVSPSIYGGLSVYGAVSGQRGGFFTGGLAVGTGVRYDRTLLDAGMFVGGGGGGSAPQGGGLMLRPHIGISQQFQDFSIGAGLSWVKFPNGGIDSKHAYVSLAFPMDVVYADSRYAGMRLASGDATDYGLRKNRSRLVAKVERYRPESGTRTTVGSRMASLDTLGFEYQYDLSPGWFAFMEAAGARDGASDGYAEALFGAGWGLPVMGPATHLNVSASLGGAGGGKVDTGGGLIGKLGVGLEHRFSPRLSAGVGVGKVYSRGEFKGSSLSLNLSYALGELNLGKHGQSVERSDEVVLQGWEVAASRQAYLKAQRKTGENNGIELVGMKLSRQLGPHAYLTGQAYGAYGGGAGGYAVGLMGAGWQYPLGSSRWSVSLEGLLGAGGGGGIAVSGGGLAQVQGGVRYRITKNLAMQLEVGKVKSLSGALDGDLVNVNLVYGFTRPEFQLFE